MTYRKIVVADEFNQCAFIKSEVEQTRTREAINTGIYTLAQKGYLYISII